MRVYFDIMNNLRLTTETDEEEIIVKTDEFKKFTDDIMREYRYTVLNQANVEEFSRKINNWLEIAKNKEIKIKATINLEDDD